MVRDAFTGGAAARTEAAGSGWPQREVSQLGEAHCCVPDHGRSWRANPWLPARYGWAVGITESVLLPLLRTEAARPLITHYDAEGGRIELSVATTVNWAAKTANWLVEEVDVEPGEPVAVGLPPHWQTLGILFGVWWCGGAVTATTAGSRAAFVPPGGSAEGAGVVAEVSLHPMGLGLTEGPRAGAVDFLEDSRLQGDDFVPPQPIDHDTRALEERDVETVLGQARARAEKLGIEQGSRVLSTADWHLPDGLLDMLAVFAGGGALVQSPELDEDTLEHRARTERTSLRLGA